MSGSFPSDFNFAKGGYKFNKTQTEFKKPSKKNHDAKNKDIYGVFFDNFEEEDTSRQMNSNEDDDPIDINYLNLQFVEGKTRTNPHSKLKIKDKPQDNEDNEEKLRNQLIQELEGKGKETPFTTKKEEKKLEDNLKRKYGKGFQMLKNAGFKVGSGLGANEQGITDPIKNEKRKKNIGIGVKENILEVLDEFDEENNIDTYDNREGNNYILGKKKKIREQLLEEGKEKLDEFENLINEWEAVKAILQKMDNIDFEYLNEMGVNVNMNKILYTSKKAEIVNLYDYKKCLSDNEYEYTSVINKYRNTPFKLPTAVNFHEMNISKIKGVLISLMKKSKEKVISYLSKIKTSEDSSIYLDTEMEKLRDDRNMSMTRVNILQGFYDDLKQVVNCTPSTDLIGFAGSFLHIQKKYKSIDSKDLPFKEATYFCIQKLIIAMKENFTLMDYLTQHNKISPILKVIKSLIDNTFVDQPFEGTDTLHIFSSTPHQDDNIPIDEVSVNDRLFGYFLYQVALKELIEYTLHQWNVKEYDRIITMFQHYSGIIPGFLKNWITEHCIMPKLVDFLQQKFEFLPNNPNAAIHLWVHPWFDVLKLESIGKICKLFQEKIERNILMWDISNENINSKMIDALQPWKKVIDDDKFWDGLREKFILPKLSYIFSKTDINPKEQKLDSFQILFKWNQSGIVTMEQSIPILLKHFFPKWLTTLHKWLKSSVNSTERINEIQKWYEGWKGLFSKNYLTFEEIKKEFKDALILIYQHTNK